MGCSGLLGGVKFKRNNNAVNEPNEVSEEALRTGCNATAAYTAYLMHHLHGCLQLPLPGLHSSMTITPSNSLPPSQAPMACLLLPLSLPDPPSHSLRFILGCINTLLYSAFSGRF